MARRNSPPSLCAGMPFGPRSTNESAFPALVLGRFDGYAQE
jgi:hypothetical protein